MTRICLLIATSVIFLLPSQTFAQSQDVPKFEVAATHNFQFMASVGFKF